MTEIFFIMGVQERRQRERAQRNNQIVDAAEVVIFDKGINGATMEDIAKEAELGKGTLYGYYKSKADILLAINERAAHKLAEMFAEASAQHQYGAHKVQAIGIAYIQFARTFPNYYQFISLFEAGNIEIEAAESMKNNHRVNCELVDAIKCGMADGTIKNDMNPEAVSKCLWGMSTGVIQLIHTKGDIIAEQKNVEAEEIFEHFFRIVTGGISTPKAFLLG